MKIDVGCLWADKHTHAVVSIIPTFGTSYFSDKYLRHLLMMSENGP